MTALATELNRTAKVEMRVGMRIILIEFAAGAAAAAARTSIGPMQQRAILCRCD